MIPGELDLLSWVLYALAVGLLVSAAAWSISFGLQRLRLPTRWVWALALGLTVVLPVSAILLPGASDASTRSGQVQPAMAPAPDGVPAVPTGGRETQEQSSFWSVLLEWGPDRTGQAAAWVNGLLGWSTRALPVRSQIDRWAAATWGATTLMLAILLFTAARHMNRRRYRWPITILRGRPVRLTPDLGPAVSGVLHPEILLPRWVLSLEARALGLILRHEEEHLRARDPLLLAGALALVVLVPWNLWLWWQFRRLRDAVELDCDRRVLHRGAAPAVYGRLLVELGSRHRRTEFLPALAMSRPLSLIETAGTGTPSLLERRLNAMKKRSVRSVLPLAIVGTAAGIALFAMACELDTPTHLPDEGATTETAEAETLGAEEADGSDARALQVLQGRVGTLQIRAPTSLRAADSPLVVVDGVIVGSEVSELPGAGEAGADTADPGASSLEGLDLDLDLASIRSIEVVKGEAARARYGERARNGILLITTEAGEVSEPGVRRPWTSPEPRGDTGDTVPPGDAGDESRSPHVEGYQSGWLLGAGDDQKEIPSSEGHAATADPLDLPVSHDAGDARSPDPLYVVDGIIVTNPVDLDADAIQQVEVIKGEAARELYGARAAGGVVQITTRRGDGT